MNANFMITPLPRTHFGPGSITELPRAIRARGTTAILVIGAESFARTDHWQRLQEELAEYGIKYMVERIRGEPSPRAVDGITSQHRDRQPGCVAAIGGGSVLDAGKAVSAMLGEGGQVVDYLEGVGEHQPSGRKIPFIAVPTTAGTGSEMTSNAVLSDVGRQGFKRSLRHDSYIPDVAVIDPSLTLACPSMVTISCAMDAFTQLVESYLSTKASAFTDDLALGAIRKVKVSLAPVCSGTGNLGDRCNMSYAAAVSGITLTNAGLGVIHGLASVVGGLFPIPHGVACATLMAAGNEVTLGKLRKKGESVAALRKYAELGRLFSAREKGSDDYYQDSFIDSLQAMTAALGVEPLSSYGIGQADIPAIARQSSSKNNPVKLDEEDLQAILSLRLR